MSQPHNKRKKWIGSNRYMLHNHVMHRMSNPPLRYGFTTGDGRRYALLRG